MKGEEVKGEELRGKSESVKGEELVAGKELWDEKGERYI